jgi:hypothetical protein
MRKYIVQFGQGIWDVGAQEYGHVDGAFLVVEDNPNYAVTDVPFPGAILLIRDEVPKLSETNQAIAAEYKQKAITIASGQLTNKQVQGEYVANGYWRTGYVRKG